MSMKQEAKLFSDVFVARCLRGAEWCRPVCVLLAGVSLTLVGCANSTGLIPDLARTIDERQDGPSPESYWNRFGTWQKVKDTPPTFIPTGHPRNLPRTEAEGEWFVDERDGKRFFVPHEAAGSYHPGILRGEAKKITNWEHTVSGAWERSWITGLPLD